MLCLNTFAFKNLIAGKWFKESQSIKKGRRRKRIKETKRQRNWKVCIFSNCLPCHNISTNYLNFTTVRHTFTIQNLCSGMIRKITKHTKDNRTVKLTQILNGVYAGCSGVSDAQLSLSTLVCRMKQSYA